MHPSHPLNPVRRAVATSRRIAEQDMLRRSGEVEPEESEEEKKPSSQPLDPNEFVSDR